VQTRTIITAASGVVAGVGVVIAAAALSTAASPAPSTSAPGYVAASGTEGAPHWGAPPRTSVTGGELSKVTAAVQAKDPAVTVTQVLKDPDGSYDVFGTKAGSGVRFEVSKDLKTITSAPDHGPGGPGGPGGGGNHTAVTGTELSSVKAAVKAKDSAVTVTQVMKDADGSYDVFGTKAGAPVRLEVSKDLKTITTDDHGPGHGRGGPGGPGGPEGGPAGGGVPSTGTPSSTA
jgi:hypothetical protein